MVNRVHIPTPKQEADEQYVQLVNKEYSAEESALRFMKRQKVIDKGVDNLSKSQENDAIKRVIGRLVRYGAHLVACNLDLVPSSLKENTAPKFLISYEKMHSYNYQIPKVMYPAWFCTKVLGMYNTFMDSWYGDELENLEYGRREDIERFIYFEVTSCNNLIPLIVNNTGAPFILI